MVWVNAGDMPSHYFGKDDGVNRLGSFIGVMAQSDLADGESEVAINSGDRLTCVKYGERIARATQRWNAAP